MGEGKWYSYSRRKLDCFLKVKSLFTMGSSNCILDLYTKMLTGPVHFSVVSDSLRSHRLYSPWNSPGQNTGVGSLSLLQQIFSIHGWNPDLPHCGQILLSAEPQRKPRDIGVSSLSLLQWIFQESNPGLLLCRCILYQLSYQESPFSTLLEVLKGKLMGGSNIPEKKKDLKAII